MSTELDVRETPSDSSTADDIVHTVCCNEGVALCGATGLDVWVEDPRPEDVCVVCHELVVADGPCCQTCTNWWGGRSE